MKQLFCVFNIVYFTTEVTSAWIIYLNVFEVFEIYISIYRDLVILSKMEKHLLFWNRTDAQVTVYCDLYVWYFTSHKLKLFYDFHEVMIGKWRYKTSGTEYIRCC